jgi:protein SCO1/2
MRKFLLIGLLALAPGVFCQDDLPKLTSIEIGIEEKLGTVIPLDLQFITLEGDTVTLGQLIDKPTILSFVYYDCPSICGPFQSGIAEVIPKVGMDLGKDYQIITISFNPLDSPDKGLKKKANYIQQLTEEQSSSWIYLVGWQENITKITSAVGYHYKPTGLDFAHPSALIVLSPQGKVTRYLFGISFLPFDVKMALIEAQKGLERPAINKVLELCFAYDNKSRGYTLQITRVVGGLTIFVALIVLLVLIFKRRKKTANS